MPETTESEVVLTCPVCGKKTALAKDKLVTCWPCGMRTSLDSWIAWKSRELAAPKRPIHYHKAGQL